MPYQEAPNTTARRGFSLIELVIVVVIIGIIGAVAVPRMSRGAQGAAVSALSADLLRLNNAVDFYVIEHDGNKPDATKISAQLTGKTNASGDVWAGAPGEVAYGPYLRTVPPLPLGDKKGNSLIKTTDGAGVGWIWVPAKCIIRPNLKRDNGTTDEALVTQVINATTLIRDDLVTP
jgi:general secretion pathway protein G